jgi:FkbM family methyltransferase
MEVAQLRQCLTKLRINCVLDVGANEGQFATRLRRLGYKGQIYSFEPNPRAFEKLREIHGGDRRWGGFPIALGSIRETKLFYVHRESSLSSFLSPLERSMVTEKVTVQVERLDTMFDTLTAELPNPHIMLKMDTQGWDVEVARGTGNALERIAALISELSVQPLYEGMMPYHDALEFYTQEGFVLYDVTPVNRAADGTVVECDCLMIRKYARSGRT